MAYLINGLVFGVHDVADGSSATALNCLKKELQRLNLSSVEDDKLKQFVSSSGDGASTQVKLNRLIEEEGGKEKGRLVENKCAMHLCVNLRSAQVKVMKNVAWASGNSDESNSDLDDVLNDSRSLADDDSLSGMAEGDSYSEGSLSSTEGADSDDNVDLSLSVGSKCIKKQKPLYSQSRNDVDQFVYEVCKLFGHCGTPEYCHGSGSFRTFLADKASSRDEYFVNAKNVVLRRQVGSQYYVTSCNTGRVFFESSYDIVSAKARNN